MGSTRKPRIAPPPPNPGRLKGVNRSGAVENIITVLLDAAPDMPLELAADAARHAADAPDAADAALLYLYGTDWYRKRLLGEEGSA